jgi:hypothetical protein
MLKIFANRRRLYQAYFVDRTAEQPEPTDPMRKGTALHTALLEPERFSELVVTYPAGVLAKNGAVSTNEAKAFRDEQRAAGRSVMKEAELAGVRAMAASVRRVCGKWLDLPGRKEQTLRWTDEQTGLGMKMRADWIIERRALICFDLKSTADASPHPFRKKIEAMHWLQPPQYIEGIQRYFGVEAVEFYFVAVEPDFPNACALYALDRASLVAATLARRRLLNTLATCIATKDFSEPWESEITRLELRDFCFDANQV